MSSDTALLVIDGQTGFLEGDSVVHQAAQKLETIRGLLARARAAGVPVIFMHHNEEPETDGPIHPAFAPLPDEPVIDKMTPDSFHETDLGDRLAALGVKKLVLCGFQTEWCVNTTTRRAAEKGFDVTLAKDGHSTFTFPGEDLNAAEIIAQHNVDLAEVAHLLEADQITF